MKWFAFILIVSSATADIIPSWRRTTWEGNAGMENGIPTQSQTVFCDVKTSIPGTNRVAIGDGATDDRVAINTAIALCPAGQVVYLPAGNYNCTSGPITFTYATACVLRGAGPTNTLIQGYITVTGPTTWNSYPTVLTGATNGSTNITVDISADPPSAIRAGWFVMIESQGDTNLVYPFGTEGNWGQYCQGQIFQLLSVDSGKTNWTFTPALYWDHSQATNARVKLNYATTSAQNFVTNVGLEDFTINAQGFASYTIDFLRCARSWVSNIEVTNDKIGGIRLQETIRCNVRSCFVHDTTTFGSGGGYGILLQLKATQNLIDNNIVASHAASILVDDGSAGNVVAYNYVPSFVYYQSNWMPNGIGSHSSHPMFNLFEGNWVTNSFFGDDIHGSSSHNTTFRNRFNGEAGATYTKQRFCVALDRKQWFYNMVGNVLGVSGAANTYWMDADSYSFDTRAIYALGYTNDLQTGASMYLHGNYDTVNAATQWASTNADHSLPNSLYLASAPTWWDSSAWPPIGSDLSPMTGTIPAQNRYLGTAASVARGHQIGNGRLGNWRQ